VDGDVDDGDVDDDDGSAAGSRKRAQVATSRSARTGLVS